MSDFDWATLIGGALQAAAVAAGLTFAGRQVRISAEQNRDAERWRRTEFAASLMERLSKDDELALCTRALDWGVGPLIIPAKHKALFVDKRNWGLAEATDFTITDIAKNEKTTDQSSGEHGAHFSHDWNSFARAVRPRLRWRLE